MFRLALGGMKSALLVVDESWECSARSFVACDAGVRVAGCYSLVLAARATLAPAVGGASSPAFDGLGDFGRCYVRIPLDAVLWILNRAQGAR